MIPRNTVQLELVYQTVLALQCHPNAERVYQAVSEAHPSVSRGTVYRNLGKLVEAGKLRRIEVPGAADRYDHTLSAHYHVRCKACGRFADLDLPYHAELDRESEAISRFQLDEHDIVFTGLCPDCQKK